MMDSIAGDVGRFLFMPDVLHPTILNGKSTCLNKTQVLKWAFKKNLDFHESI